MPRHIAPMLATPADRVPQESGFAYEFKWDGHRLLLHLESGRLRIESRRMLDVTPKYPELQALTDVLGRRQAILDGEIVALDDNNRPNFGLLQKRLGFPGSGSRAEKTTPVVFFAFDLLYLDRRSLLRASYKERRRRLQELDLNGPSWRTPTFEVDRGSAMLEASSSTKLEGIVAKRLDSLYEPGTRSTSWLKIKVRKRQEFVIGGWTAGEGARSGTLGALLLGYYDRRASEKAATGRRPRLLYAGRVGTGFDERMLRELIQALEPLRRASNPFDEGDPGSGARFVEPRLVAEVTYSEWTQQGVLRHTVFQGLRLDKDSFEVVREATVTKPTKKEV